MLIHFQFFDEMAAEKLKSIRINYIYCNMTSNATVFSILLILMICTLITQNSSGVLVLNQVDFITVIFSQSLDYEKQVLEIFSVADGVYYQLEH